MALTTLETNIVLDVYDHDGTRPSIKSIALDDNTRYVFARLTYQGNTYDIGSTASVKLVIIRPDKVGAQIAGEAKEIQIGQEDESIITIYGAYAELDQPAIAVAGTLLGQFIITSGNQILRSQIFAVNNGEALDADEWAGQYDGYNLDELVAKVDNAVEKVDDMEADVTELKSGLIYKVNSATIYCDDVEDGYYSNNNGQKMPNSSSSHYKRTKTLIPVEEGALYVADRNTMCVCFDKDGTFIKKITIYSATDKYLREIIPTGTTHVGLSATNAPSFTLTKINASEIKGIEYPYASEGCIHVPSCWCNGNGGVSSTANFDMLVIPVKEGERWYVSNQADYNLICLDATGTKLTATYESCYPIGKVVTVPAGAKTMYVNLYRARTKGVNSEMSDYVARVDGKKILAIGDSLTWLDGRNGSYGGMSYFSGWQRQLRLAGHDVISAGFSGYPYATGLDVVDGVDHSIYKEIVTNAYDVSGYDMVILFGGTNDVLYNGALGDRPTDYSNRTFDASKFNGALGAIISYIRTNNTTARILLASFPKSEAATRSYPNARSRVSEIEYNADFWSCKYINVWEDLNVQPTYDGFDQFFYDTTHANFLGMERIGQIMLNAVNTYARG
jgi:lysophospholipase L1-like esterase